MLAMENNVCPSARTPKALETLAIAALLLSACGLAPSYTFDRSGATPVLTAELQPGMAMRRNGFEVFGDGRVIVTIRNAGGAGEVLASYETRVPPERVEEVLDRAVGAGLGDFDNRATVAELRAAGRFPQLPTDLGSVALTLHLETYQRPGSARRGPYVHKIVATEPRAIARALPEIHEYQALASLMEFLDECHRAAAASAKAGPDTRQPPASAP